MIINSVHSFEKIPPVVMDSNLQDNLIIDFTPLSWDTWRDICARAKRFPLTQSYEYACAVAGYIILTPTMGGHPRGKYTKYIRSCSDFEVGIPKLWVQSIIIDRGPVWFHGADTTHYIQSFWEKINHEYPVRFWRQRRFIPEQICDESGRTALISCGLRPRNTLQPYQTIWLDLTPSLDQIKKKYPENMVSFVGKGT